MLKIILFVLTITMGVYSAENKQMEKSKMSQEVLPGFSYTAQSMVFGSVYEHYSRGLRYKILAVARHSETLEELVVYQALYGDYDVWVRPLAMFLETVMSHGQAQPRFKLVE